MSGNQKEWLRPDEFMKIQQKKLKLQERLKQQSRNRPSKLPAKSSNNEFVTNNKRNNPFAKDSEQDLKRTRPELPAASEGSIFELIHNTGSNTAANLEAPCQEPIRMFPKEIEFDADEGEVSDTELPKPTKLLPVDWSIKSRVRILSKTLVVSNNFQSNEEASGLTGFVRCLDTKPTSTISDNSNRAKFQQNLLYWQYPHLPWLDLVQRNSATNNQFKMNEIESESLLKDWMASYRNLFQLLRALHCPYFYVLANQFTVLFRAAGIGGRSQMHALLTPTTRGFRKLLKEEDIEFSQPLKTSTQNASLVKESEEDEEEDEMKYLESLGVETSDIKFKDDVKSKLKEVEDDNGELSTILIEGADCQALFDFLLNAKSTVPKIGRLAGIPPTLLSPVAFVGGSLRKQTTRSSKLRLDGQDIFSIELKGAILPHTVHTLCAFLSEIKDNYSLVMMNYPHTVAFSKSSRQLLADLETLTTSDHISAQMIATENLSDCGLVKSILERMCKSDTEAVNIIERLTFDRENGFTLF